MDDAHYLTKMTHADVHVVRNAIDHCSHASPIGRLPTASAIIRKYPPDRDLARGSVRHRQGYLADLQLALKLFDPAAQRVHARLLRTAALSALSASIYSAPRSRISGSLAQIFNRGSCGTSRPSSVCNSRSMKDRPAGFAT